MPSDVMEDYLKAIYSLERAGETPVSTSRIAEYLDVTRPTVSSMIERLTERNLLERENTRVFASQMKVRRSHSKSCVTTVCLRHTSPNS